MTASTSYYRPGTSWLHRRNPFTKLLALGLVLLSAFLLPPLLLPVSTGLVLLAGHSTGLLGPLVRTLRVPALLLTSILIVNAFFFPGATDRLIAIGPIALTREGLAFGLTAAARVLVVFLASVLLLFTTIADDLLESLVARGASHRIAFVMLTSVQMVPRLQDRARSILDAQQARGLRISGSFGSRARALVPLIGPVLLGSLLDVRERTFALEARGFGALPRRTAYRLVPDPPVDRVARIALLVGMIGLVLTTILGLWTG